jgi:hypothetical protein
MQPCVGMALNTAATALLDTVLTYHSQVESANSCPIYSTALLFSTLTPQSTFRQLGIGVLGAWKPTPHHTTPLDGRMTDLDRSACQSPLFGTG